MEALGSEEVAEDGGVHGGERGEERPALAEPVARGGEAGGPVAARTTPPAAGRGAAGRLPTSWRTACGIECVLTGEIEGPGRGTSGVQIPIPTERPLPAVARDPFRFPSLSGDPLSRGGRRTTRPVAAMAVQAGAWRSRRLCAGQGWWACGSSVEGPRRVEEAPVDTSLERAATGLVHVGVELGEEGVGSRWRFCWWRRGPLCKRLGNWFAS